MTGRWLGRSGHAAEPMIGEGRGPSPEEARHLETCPDCFAAVRRGRSFDRQLADAVETLPSPAIPPEVLTMPMPSIRRPSMPSATSFGVIVALVVAAGLVTWTVLPRAGAAASAPPSVPPDPHLVVVDGATWRIGLVGRTVEIHRSVGDPGSGEELLASWDLGDFVNGGWTTFLHCPRPDGHDQWVFVGHSADAEAQGLIYSGPPATGQIAPDGLWFWVLDPLRFDPAMPVFLKQANGRAAFGSGGGLKADPADVRQPSGCFAIE